MSGASALAAAKRRRGMSTAPPPPRPGGGPPRGPPRGPPQRQQQSGVPTPMQLLENHHKRIANLENMMNETTEELKLVGNNKNNNNIVSNKVNDNLVKQVMALEAKIAVLQDKLYGTEDEPIEDIAYFKEKMQSIELQMAELKQHVLKIQTFAMETNLALMKERQQQQMTNKEEDDEVAEAEEEVEVEEENSNEEQEVSNEEEEEVEAEN